MSIDMESIDTDKLTRVYEKIRKARSENTKEYEARDKELKAQLETVGAALLSWLIDNNMQSSHTANGLTFYKEEIVTPTAADWNIIYEWIAENDAWEALEKRLTKTFFKNYMKDHDGAIPPGVNIYREYVARVRRT